MTPTRLAIAFLALAALSPASGAQSAPTNTVLTQEIQPPPYTLWTADGVTIDNTHLNPGGFWLLLYRDLNSARGDEALTLLESLTTPPTATDTTKPAVPLDPARLVVVLTHATGAQVSQLQLNHPLLAKATWLRDEKETAAQALGLHGSPHLIGMHESALRWQLAGSLESPAARTAITYWVKNNDLPQNKLVLHKVKLAPPPPTTAAAAQAAALAGASARHGANQ
ncbi:hypothetical protein [Granulicella sibirica]|uniref:Uncharacterized protein n=1 Tax=Granulicella sibirica TaxID=2479048 RepID=A0A4Q0T6Y4_9BACT|nr:hypothetical protein [Granulicella sibirica]RXH58430.1 hypothetical protein GRAN_1740 [Granulicella sibirica]